MLILTLIPKVLSRWEKNVIAIAVKLTRTCSAVLHVQVYVFILSVREEVHDYLG